MTRFSIIEEELLASAKLTLKEKLAIALEDIEDAFEVYAPPDIPDLSEIRSLLARLVADEKINDRIRRRACVKFVERFLAEPKKKARPKKEFGLGN